MIKIYIDGGSRGNPGHSAVGVAIYRGEDFIHGISKYIGITTNNIAEYSALIEALSWLVSSSIDRSTTICIYMDSQLVYAQFRGFYKVKNKKIKEVFQHAKSLERDSGFIIHYFHIPREKNTIADSLVNKALDQKREKLYE